MGRLPHGGRLDVYLGREKAGTLVLSQGGALEYSYSETWADRHPQMPISGSMPVTLTPYRGAEVSAFFDNLLPDNIEIRRAIASRVSAGSTAAFDLLSAIGRDCVGALQFLPAGEPRKGSAKITAERITPRAIGGLLKDLKTAPLGLDRGREFRISIAGAQEKTALLRWKSGWYRPTGATPTSHILKPAIGMLPNGIDMSQSVENEWVSLELCGFFGLRTARTEIAEFDSVKSLVVERFDRRWSAGRRSLLRIPQEDLCQALGIPWTRKYESDGGPGIAMIMRYLDSSDHRDRDRADFIRAQLVFFLLGAIDGHGKNFSVFLTDTGFSLTPLYDVMSIHPALASRQLEPREATLSMKVGTKNSVARLDRIRRHHWEETAKACGFPLSDLDFLIQDLVERSSRLENIAKDLKAKAPGKMVDSILWGIHKGLAALLPLHTR